MNAQPLVRYALSQPGEKAVGSTAWTYNDAMVSLIAPILRRAEGADLAQFYESRYDAYTYLAVNGAKTRSRRRTDF